MKTFKKVALAWAATFFCVGYGHAGTIKLSGAVDNESGLSISKTVPVNLNNTSIDQLAIQVNWSTAGTPAPLVFTDGSESTFTATVVNSAGLSTATASDFLTVLSTNNLANACISFFNGTPYQVCNGGKWRIDVTSDTAADIAAQMSLVIPVLLSTSNTSSNVYSTSTLTGTFVNSWTLSTNTSSITVNSPTFTGGQDAGCLGINNIQVCAGQQFTVGSSSAVTANNIATVINSTFTAGNLGLIVKSTAPLACGLSSPCGVIYTTSTSVGLNTNYATYSSTQGSLTIAPFTSSGPLVANGFMSGGTNFSYLINTTVIASTGIFSATGKTPMVALPVLYTNSGTNITGLTTGTTYFLIPVTPTAFGLSSTSTGAVAGFAKLPVVSTTTAGVPDGTFILLSSSQTKTTADTFTLTASSYSATVALTWQVSNDCVNYTNYVNSSTGTVTLTPTSSTQASAYDFGTIDFACVQANLVRTGASQSSGLIMSIIANGKNSGL